jgi:hypothetical protein
MGGLVFPVEVEAGPREQEQEARQRRGEQGRQRSD